MSKWNNIYKDIDKDVDWLLVDLLDVGWQATASYLNPFTTSFAGLAPPVSQLPKNENIFYIRFKYKSEYFVIYSRDSKLTFSSEIIWGNNVTYKDVVFNLSCKDFTNQTGLFTAPQNNLSLSMFSRDELIMIFLFFR